MKMSELAREVGINMKTIETVKPVIDAAVKEAGSVQQQVEDTKDAVKGGKTLDLAKDISQQANPEVENKQAGYEGETKSEIAAEAKAPVRTGVSNDIESPDV